MPAGKQYKPTLRKAKNYIWKHLFNSGRIKPLTGNSNPIAEEKPQTSISLVELGGKIYRDVAPAVGSKVFFVCVLQ